MQNPARIVFLRVTGLTRRELPSGQQPQHAASSFFTRGLVKEDGELWGEMFEN
jgi:hypothetical protein